MSSEDGSSIRLPDAEGGARAPDGGCADDAPRILVVDDDPIAAESIADLLARQSYALSICCDPSEALGLLKEAETPAGGDVKARPFSLVISDVAMPGMSGMQLLQRIREEYPGVVVILVTGYGTIESAVRAIRAGAFDYLAKPVVDSELTLTVERALNHQALVADNARLRRQLDARYGIDGMIGNDHRMQKAYEVVDAVAASKATVLVTGESGTGKSMVARAMHQRSDRASGPYVELHCGSIPETLLESELFGHVAGAFTGANADKEGRFLAAHGGTIFIDEINSASPALQLKLLRVLQERRFEPVGSTKTMEVDVRVVLATNEGLEQLVAEGRFREDLYYRINVVKIELPALRERIGDIPPLTRHFLEKYALEHGKIVAGITDEAIETLQRYSFPGNVRELENVIERTVLLARRPTIEADDLPPFVTGSERSSLLPSHARAGLVADGAIDAPDTPWSPTPLGEALKEPERRIILKALRANDWNRQKTAEQLGINRTTLYKKMKTLDLDEYAG